MTRCCCYWGQIIQEQCIYQDISKPLNWYSNWLSRFLSLSQKQMLTGAQDAKMVLWRVYFEKVLATSSFPAVSHIKSLIADNLTHPTRNKSLSLSITVRLSTKQIRKDFCCNYLQKSCQQILPRKRILNIQGFYMIFYSSSMIRARNHRYFSSNISNPTICNNRFGTLNFQPSSLWLLLSPKISLLIFGCNCISDSSKLGSEY